MFRKLNPTQLYYVIAGASSFTNALMFTVGTVYFVSSVGLDPLQLVLVGTVLEGTVLLFEVPTGVVADTLSRRLSVILGMLMLGAGFAVVGLAPAFTAILIAQVITGIGYTFLSGATQAWLADEIGEANVGRVYLRSGQIGRLLGIAGTFASVAIASYRLDLPYLSGGLLYLLLGLFLILFMPERGFTPIPRGERTTWRTLGDTLSAGARVVRSSPALTLLLVVAVIAGAASEGFDRLGDAHILGNFTLPDLGPLQPVVWFGIISVSGQLFSLLTTEIFRRRLEVSSRQPRSTMRWLLALNSLTAASVVLFALAGNFPLAFAALLFKAALGALSSPLYEAWLVSSIAPQSRATVLSMFGQSDALGQVTIGPLVGLVGNLFSLRAAITLSGLLLSPASLFYAYLLRSGRLMGANEGLPEGEMTGETVYLEQTG